MALNYNQMGDLSGMDAHIVNGYQFLSQGRMQAAIFHQGLASCMSKCMDLTDLYTEQRAKMPGAQRLKLEASEKECLNGCGAKWDDMYKREVMTLNKKEVTLAQMTAIIRAQEEAIRAADAKRGYPNPESAPGIFK